MIGAGFAGSLHVLAFCPICSRSRFVCLLVPVASSRFRSNRQLSSTTAFSSHFLSHPEKCHNLNLVLFPISRAVFQSPIMASRPVSAHAAVPDADGPDSVSRVDKRPLPEPSESGPAPKLHRPRASRACESCHARKVRCDVVLSNPCTNCRLDRVAVRLPELSCLRTITLAN